MKNLKKYLPITFMTGSLFVFIKSQESRRNCYRNKNTFVIDIQKKYNI